MIRIPLPQQGQTSLVSQPAQGVAPVTGGNAAPQQLQQLGGALQQAGAVGMEIASVMRLEHDSAQTKQAYTRFAEHVTELLENPDTGYLHKVGQAASGENGAERARVLDDIETRMKTIEDGLKTPVARGMFREAAAKRLQEIRGRVYSHEATQRRVWHLGETRAMQAQAERDAVDSALWGEVPNELAVAGQAVAQAQDAAEGRQNPAGSVTMAGDAIVAPGQPSAAQGEAEREMWRRHLDTALEQAAEEAELLGQPAAVRDLMVAETKSRVHSAIIGGLLEQDRTKQAREFLGKLGDDALTPEDRVKVTRRLQLATEADRSRALGIELFNDLTSPATDPELQVAITEWVDEPDQHLDVMAELMEARKKAGIGQVPVEKVEKAVAWEGEVRRSMTAGQSVQDATDSMLGRASADLRRRFEAGDISAREMDLAMSYVREQHAILLSERTAEAASALDETERFFAGNPFVTDVNSPSFPQPLRDRLLRSGKLLEARRLAAGLTSRVTDPAVYRQLIQDDARGLLKQMTEDQLFVRYYSALGANEWHEAQSRWADANKMIANKPIDLLVSLEDKIARIAGRYGIVTGQKTDGTPQADNEDESPLFFDFRYEVLNRWNLMNSMPGRQGKPLSTEEMLAIAEEVAQERIELPGTFGNAEAFAWQRDQEGQEDQFIYTSSVGSKFRSADINPDAVPVIADAYRLTKLPSADAKRVNAAIRAIMAEAGTSKGLARTRIEDLWDSLGMSGVTPSPQFRADQWERMVSTPGSKWYIDRGEGGIGSLFDRGPSREIPENVKRMERAVIRPPR